MLSLSYPCYNHCSVLLRREGGRERERGREREGERGEERGREGEDDRERL